MALDRYRMHREKGIHQRYFYVLPLPRSLSMEQGMTNGSKEHLSRGAI